MAEEELTPEGEESEEEAPKKGRLIPILMIVIGLAGGAAAGLLFVGPTVFGGPAEAAAESSDEEASDDHSAPSEGQEGDESESGAAPADGNLHTIANIIVNPAGSGGNRFLLVDLSLALSDDAEATELEARDVELRDALLALFGSQTVQQLTDIAQREVLKTDIRSLITGLLSHGEVEGIYFPRFVIQ